MRPSDVQLRNALQEANMELKPRALLAQRILLPTTGDVYEPIELKQIVHNGETVWMLEWEEYASDVETYESKMPGKRITRRTVPLQGCLWEFVCLVNKEREAALEFARKWGILGCALEIVGSNGNRVTYREPVRTYFDWARKLRILMLLSAQTKSGTITPENMETYYSQWPLEEYEGFGYDFIEVITSSGLPDAIKTCCESSLLSQIGRKINQLLDMTGALPHIKVEGKETTLVLDATQGVSRYNYMKSHMKSVALEKGYASLQRVHPLLQGTSPLFIKLVFELIGAETFGVYVCGRCGQLFHERVGSKKKERNYTPRQNETVYCSDECSDAAHRDQQRESRRRNPRPRIPKPLTPNSKTERA